VWKRVEFASVCVCVNVLVCVRASVYVTAPVSKCEM